jgi:O-antigen/teichoic acid export membrane protein
MAFGWTCVGAELVTCVYGQKYLDAGTLVPILGLLQAMFVVRDLHGVIAMSSGDSRHPVVGNILRIVGLAFVIPVAWMGWGMVGAAWVALTWELIAYVYSALCLRQKHDVHLLTLLRPMAWIPGGSAAGAALHHACILQGISPWAVLLVGMLAIAGWWTLRNARTDRALANIATTG